MSFLLRKVSSFYTPDWKDFLLNVSSQITSSVTRQIAEKTFHQILNPLVGDKTISAIQISYPSLHKTQKIAKTLLKKDFNTVAADFQQSPEKGMQSVIIMVNEPGKVFSLHTEQYVKKGSLKYICSALEKIAQSSIGHIIYVAPVPVAAPSTARSSISSWMMFKLAAAASITDGNQEVELDDLRCENSYEIVEEPDCQDDWEVLDEQT